MNQIARRSRTINVRIWIKERYKGVVNSIAFYPAIIALMFLALSALSISFDFSEAGKHLKAQIQWLRLQDPSTARSIISSIAAGVLSLTVFSFSMVMIVLNQTASQMSNRMLDKLIGSRFQQIVLGVYVGTIVYALFLLSAIRDVDAGIHIPALSTYFLIALTICDIFLFIYFLHYITQSVKYDVIIDRIYREPKNSLTIACSLSQPVEVPRPQDGSFTITINRSGVYEGLSDRDLMEICERHDCILFILPAPGNFLLEGTPVITSSRVLPDEVVDLVQNALYIHTAESIDENYFYGFNQLTEVAIKALSPGINDPATAVQALRALFKLLHYNVSHFPSANVANEKGQVRIVKNELTFERIFNASILPIWDYGKHDRLIQHELALLLEQMQSLARHESVGQLLAIVRNHDNALKN